MTDLSDVRTALPARELVVRRTRHGVRRLLPEVTKFGIVGAANTVLDIALFNLLRSGVLHDLPLAAKAVSITVAAVCSYVGNRRWTWAGYARTGVRRELPLFLLLSAVGLALNEVVLAVSHYLLGFRSLMADNVAGNVLGLGVAMAWRFWSFKRWVFLEPGAVDTRRNRR